MSNIETPISEARTRFRALKKRRRRLSPQDRAWYYALRYLQGHTDRWRYIGKEQLTGMATESLEGTQGVLREWVEFRDWFEAQGSTIPDSRMKPFRLLEGRIAGAIRDVQEVVEDYEDDDDVLQTIKDSIASAAMRVGLEVYEPWEDADDGAVWFVNPDTGAKHYFLLGRHSPEGWPFEIMSRPVESRRVEQGWNQWERVPAVDLSNAVIPWSTARLHHPARFLDSYFGAYNGLGIVEKDLPESVERALDSLRNIVRRKA